MRSFGIGNKWVLIDLKCADGFVGMQLDIEKSDAPAVWLRICLIRI